LSSILKALKKLEQDSYNNSRPYKASNIVKTGKRSGLINIVSIHRLLIIAVLVAGFGFSGYFIFNDNKPGPEKQDTLAELPKPVLFSKVTDKRSAKSISKPFLPPENKLPDVLKKRVSENRIADNEPTVVLKPPVSENRIADNEPSVVLKPSVSENRIADNEPSVVLKPPVAENRIADNEPSVVLKPPVAENKSIDFDENKDQDIQKITDQSWLKLQAISWNNIPEQRIAVINNSVVHEGSRVTNGLVERIDQQHIIIRSQDQKWKLMFGQ
jgi:hypothetical protein